MKNKFLKGVLLLVAIFILLITGVLTYVKTMLPNVGDAPVIKVELTDANINRGEYLANHVMVCMDCHSGRNWSVFSGSMIPNTLGQGGETFDQKLGFPGKFISKNITPFKLKDWSDGEIFRAITSGISKDGSALFPVMPHPNYGKLDVKDIYAVIAYLRSLKPIEKENQASEADFPMNFIINTIPQKPNFTTIPDTSDKLNYGEYLVTAASCRDCHTKQEKGQFVGKPFAGGMEFKFPNGSIVRSLNITPHTTGIGNWTEEQFVSRFQSFADSSYVPHTVKEGEFQTVMPWLYYAKMTENDLKSIFVYLRSLEPVDNTIERFTKK